MKLSNDSDGKLKDTGSGRTNRRSALSSRQNRMKTTYSLIHRIGYRLLNWFFRALFAVRLSDVCSGIYPLTTRAARQLDFIAGGLDVEVEIRVCYVTASGVGYYNRHNRTASLTYWLTGIN